MSHSFPEPVGGRAKRILDLAIALPVLVVLAPVFAVIAILIRRDSPGRAFYRQTRVGLDGREFQLIKFRTMIDGAEFVGAGLDNDVGDPRITSVGARLRALSIDELPQLINVLVGDMSIVGPRPTLRDQVERYTPEQCRRLRARPGITGLAQISGRSTLPWSQRIVIDVHYVDNWSLRLDLAIMRPDDPGAAAQARELPGRHSGGRSGLGPRPGDRCRRARVYGSIGARGTPRDAHHPGQLAQRESTRFTREGSLVRSQYCPSNPAMRHASHVDGTGCRNPTWPRHGTRGVICVVASRVCDRIARSPTRPSSRC